MFQTHDSFAPLFEAQNSVRTTVVQDLMPLTYTQDIGDGQRCTGVLEKTDGGEDERRAAWTPKEDPGGNAAEEDEEDYHESRADKKRRKREERKIIKASIPSRKPNPCERLSVGSKTHMKMEEIQPPLSSPQLRTRLKEAPKIEECTGTNRPRRSVIYVGTKHLAAIRHAARKFPERISSTPTRTRIK